MASVGFGRAQVSNRIGIGNFEDTIISLIISMELINKFKMIYRCVASSPYPILSMPIDILSNPDCKLFSSGVSGVCSLHLMFLVLCTYLAQKQKKDTQVLVVPVQTLVTLPPTVVDG